MDIWLLVLYLLLLFLLELKYIVSVHTCFTLIQESNIDEWKEAAVTSIDLLCATIEREDARLEENISATEEALAAVIKIMKYCDEKMVGIGRMNEVHFDTFISWNTLLSSKCWIPN